MRSRRVLALALATVGMGLVVDGVGVAQAAPPASAQSEQPIVVTTRLTPESSLIGDRLDLRVIAAYPQGYAVNLPTGFAFGDFHVIESEASDPESGGQGLRKTFHIYFQTFETGVQRTPTFDLTYVDPDGEVQTVAVPPHEFEVRSLLENEVDPQRKGEDEPVSQAYPNERAELAIQVALGVLLASALAWWALARWRRREEESVAPPPIPAHLVALEALDALESAREQMIEDGAFPDYYVELTRILKGYVEGRFGVEALDRTTDELRRLLSRPEVARRLGEVEPEALLRFLQSCDLIKFARFSPTPEEAREALKEVRDIVELTRPRRAAPESQGSDEPSGADGEAAAPQEPREEDAA